MKTLFNENWQFCEIAIDEKLNYQNEQKVLFTSEQFYDESQKSSYNNVNLPHDWQIVHVKELYKNSVGVYKKTVTLTKKQVENRFNALYFEGVYMNCAVWCNGKKVGENKYGYSAFEVDISDFVCEGENTIQVICVYQNCNTRWYSGAGIFRDVFYINSPKNHLVSDGVYFSAKIEQDSSIINALNTNQSGNWNVKIYSEVASINDEYKNLKVENTITDTNKTVLYKSAKLVSPTFDENKNSFVAFESFSVQNPKLWDITQPNLYILHTKLFDQNNNILDETTQYAGFKHIHFDSNKGFFLNGRHVKIYGACHHHDLGVLGAAFDKNALKRQFTKLKEMGVNSVRSSHNPPPKKWMDLCDEMGILVCDESFDMWEMNKTPFDYANYFTEWSERDTISWVKKDRNHPSLLMWSIGNEIYDAHVGSGEENTKRLYSIVRKYDFEQNAPITFASNFMMSENTQKCGEHLDLVGYNYLERLYDEHHKKYPKWKIFGSETCSTIQSRGIYHFPESLNLVTFSDGQCSVLGNCSTNWGAKNTQTVIANDRDCEYSSGQYIWTGWDYIGEPTPYHTKNSFFGQIDTAGFEKDTFYLFKSEWAGKNAEPFVHLLPYWDWNENQTIDIKAYTNADAVELFVNGKSFGLQKINHVNGKEPFGRWRVPFVKGKIEAICYDENGNEIAKESKSSFGDPKKIILKPEPLETGDLFFIQIMLADENGTLTENARNFITFNVTGDAELVGMDNGDSTDYDEYVGSGKSHTRRLFSNRLIALVKAHKNGTQGKSSFVITAASKGFENVSLKYDGENWVEVSPYNAIHAEKDEIPSRKIELSFDDKVLNQNKIVLTKQNPKITVTAKVFPENATNKEINWNVVLKECVPCDFIKVTDINGKGSGTETATIEAVFDGECILRCTAKNGTIYDEVISDLHFVVKDMARAKLNPFDLIEGCKFTDWDKTQNKPVLSLESGITTRNCNNTWISFEQVDFGKNGADTIHIPIFSFDTALPIKIFDGKPDLENQANMIFSGTYKSPSVYNTYNENVFVLHRRLFGMHEISFVFETGLEFKGFYFEKSLKAFSKLCSLDATNIVGDSFTKTTNTVEKIGNNVCFDFTDMDFGEKSATKLTMYGKSNTANNTIHVKFFDQNGKSETKVIEFAGTSDYTEKSFEIGNITGKQTVSFVFLPGSNFDFAWFKFE